MTEQKESQNKKYIILIAVLALISIVLGVLLFNSANKVKETTQTVSSLEVEQLQLQNDLQEMLIQYDTITVDNDRLNAEILGQQEQIKDMLKQIEKNKDDAYIISKLKKEAATLRDIMKGYLVTIDSLNTLNKDLQANNQVLATELSQTKSRADKLESKKSELEEVVATGSILQARGMSSVGLRIRNNGKQVEINKADKTELIKTCTEIAENRISPSGRKVIYLRIISPDGVVLDANDGEDNRFEFNGVSGKYSVMRVINYENEGMELCIFYTVTEGMELATGKYIIEMYESGALIGKTDFDLK